MAKSCGTVGIAEELRRESDEGANTDVTFFGPTSLYYNTVKVIQQGNQSSFHLSLLPIF